MSRWQAVTDRIAVGLPDRGDHARLLVICCIHNRGFRFVADLVDAVKPDLVVNVGDISGIGGPLERLVLSLLRINAHQVFALGNHDSAVTARAMRRKGALVLDRPELLTILLHPRSLIGRVWGYRDPNRSPLGGPPYNPDLCREAALRTPPPDDGDPYLVAVHNNRMVANLPPEVRLILCGHTHVPRVWRDGDRTFARCGTTGGGGLHWPWRRPGPCQALVVDLALPQHAAERVWLVESDRKWATVQEA